MALQVVTANGSSLGGPTATRKTATGGLQNAVQPTSTYNPAYTMPVSTQLYNTPLNGGYVAGAQAPAPQQYTYADGTYAGTGTGGAAAAQASAQTVAEYDAMIRQLQAQEGRLGQTEQVGLGNIGNAYNLGRNRLDEQKGIAQRNFNTQTGLNTQSYLGARNGIKQNTRATANALQRLLGINGAGNSSAALEQAPYAAGLQGSTQLNGAQQTFSNNTNTLNTGWEDTERSYKNNTFDLDQQKYSQENSLRSSIAQTRAGILDRLGETSAQKALASGAGYGAAQAQRDSYQSRVNSLLDQITGLGNQYQNPVLKTGDVNFKSNPLDAFSLGNMAQINNQGGARANMNPGFLNLVNPQEEEEERLI